MEKKIKKQSMGEYLKKLVNHTENGHLEAQFLRDIRAIKLPIPETQYKWHPDRQFRADFAYPSQMLLIECDGGTWRQGGHSTGEGIERDRIKDAEAMILGFKTLRVTGNMIREGTALLYLEKIFKGIK